MSERGRGEMGGARVEEGLSGVHPVYGEGEWERSLVLSGRERGGVSVLSSIGGKGEWERDLFEGHWNEVCSVGLVSSGSDSARYP